MQNHKQLPKGRGRPRLPADMRKSRTYAASIKEAIEREGTNDPATSVRLQINLEPHYAVSIETARMLTKISSVADLIRRSLDLYFKILRHVRKGDRIVIETKKGDKLLLIEDVSDM